MRRIWVSLVCALFVFVAIAFAAPVARADPAPLLVQAASHEGRASGDRILWKTTLHENQTPDETVPAKLRLLLAAGLPRETKITSPGAVAVVEPNGVVAIDIDLPPDWRTAITIETEQPIGAGEANGVALAPPLVAGLTPQVIVVAGPNGRRFQPDPSLHLVRHVGFLAPDDVDAKARHECAALTGSHALPLDAEPIYVRGTSLIAGALHGRITTADERNRPGAIVIGIVFVVSAILLVVLYRRLTSSAQVERADAELRAAFDGIGRSGSRDSAP